MVSRPFTAYWRSSSIDWNHNHPATLMNYILSRAYVEFGPFTKAELLDFSQRSLLRVGDFIRPEHSHHWEPWETWLHEHAPTSPPPKAVPAKKAAAKKAAPAKKSSAKRAPAKKSAKSGS